MTFDQTIQIIVTTEKIMQSTVNCVQTIENTVTSDLTIQINFNSEQAIKKMWPLINHQQNYCDLWSDHPE